MLFETNVFMSLSKAFVLKTAILNKAVCLFVFVKILMYYWQRKLVLDCFNINIGLKIDL